MRYGLSVMNLGDLADARVFADLARRAEAAGWDAVLTWDHLGFAWGAPAADSWTLVTAAALVTERVLVGTDVAIIARERPLPFASRVATVDRLSRGRVILGVGLGGADEEYRAAGEPVDRRERAALTDEMLDVVGRLLDGAAVDHEGPRVTVRDVTLDPTPGRHVPVWIGGSSAGARRRAARHDGWIPYPFDEQGRPVMSPEMLRAGIEEITALRDAIVHEVVAFEVGVHGETPADPSEAAGVVRSWHDAGATWWLESIHGYRGGLSDLLERVEAGPPRA